MGKKREVEPGAPCRLTIEVAVPIVEPADGHGRQPRSYCTRRVGGLVAEEEQQQHRFVHEGWVAELLGAPVRLCAVLKWKGDCRRSLGPQQSGRRPAGRS